MKLFYCFIVAILFLSLTRNILAQNNNCFLDDWESKNAVIPLSLDEQMPVEQPTITITTTVSDTVGKISKYIYGNALACWIGSVSLTNNPLIGYLQKLSPSLIRYPGGSWSDYFFWNGNPGDLPDSIYDGTTYNSTTGTADKVLFTPQYGMGSWPTTVTNYYNLRNSVNNTEGLISINYAYARYGTGLEPVKRAAHLAADWVRYDNGKTKFWEIGNENGGPWEPGWMIDTSDNQDGQPVFVSGALYGEHFNVFVDSMRAAANEVGSTIYIGGQIIHYDGTNSWNFVDRLWNQGFFNAVGDNADFYVIHNYFGNNTTARALLDSGTTIPKNNMEFIRQDIINKQATDRPIALTEWNINVGGTSKSSFINGMQSVLVSCEMMKQQAGMTARWLIANWENDGMFYKGNSSTIPVWNPRPDVFYLYYLQRFFGDHIVQSTSDNSAIVSYASTFASGEIGMAVINKGTTDQVIRINLLDHGVGDKLYIYSLTGGTDNGDFSQYVTVNDYAPVSPRWGPIDELESIEAYAFPIDEEIKFYSPKRSVQFIMIEPGNNILSAEKETGIVEQFSLNQNYPNPFNPSTKIEFSIPQTAKVKLTVYDILGNEISTLVNEEKSAGIYSVSFDTTSKKLNLTSGIYCYTLNAGNFIQTKKMILLK